VREVMTDAPPPPSVHIGTPPHGYQEWTSIKIHIHGFADLSATRGTPVYSPEFMAFGNPWRLKLYPGGRNDSKRGWIAVFLKNQSNKSFEMQYGFSIKDGTGKPTVSLQSSPAYVTFGPMGSFDCGRGFPNFAERSTIIDSLVDGTLVVEVNMKPLEPIKAALPQFIP
jgi:hypothetical protein